MDKKFVDFIRSNQNNVYEFGKKLKQYHDGLRKLVDTVNGIVRAKLPDLNFNQRPWRSLPELFDIAVTDIDLDTNTVIAIDSRVDPAKWEFQIFVRKSTDSKFDLSAFCRSKMLEGGINKENRFVLTDTLSLDTEASMVAEKITDIITKITVK